MPQILRFIFSMRRSALILTFLIAGLAVVAHSRPAAASAETDCFNFVQGNIPWNYSGSSTWAANNVKNLCSGTTHSAEPGRCFDRVMTGGINWGGGTQWQWQNALNLCKGANSADTRIQCFQGKISGGKTWAQAIPECTASATPPPPPSTTAAETACFNFVQGNIPWDYNGSTSWSPTNVKNLCKGTSHASEPGRCFDHVMHGSVNWGGSTQWQWQNALNLCKGSENADNTVACFQSQITGGETWQAAISACKS